jgi:CDP-glucose 4,6-dehydratase
MVLKKSGIKMDQNFYRNKKIFLSGHTGFKGAWLSCWLKMMGAKVCGFSLKPENESLFNILELSQELDESHFGDIRNAQLLEKTINNFQPEIIIHMAAQALVKASYFDPRTTYETNVIGTLNIFEAARKAGSVKAIVNITTDKCYENKEINYAYQEEDPMGGYDPYSSSKACAEILTSSYRRSFMQKEGIALASVRAGNVIGGGDFSIDRIIPDIFRSIRDGKKVELRSPNAVRPWQHVMEPLLGYLTLAQNLFEKGNDFAKAYNFGPDFDSQENVETLTKNFIQKIGVGAYEINDNADLHEAGILMLNNNRAKNELKWQPRLSFNETISWTADWYKNYIKNKDDVRNFTIEQIKNFLAKKRIAVSKKS